MFFDIIIPMLKKVTTLALLVSAWALPVAAGFDMVPTQDGQCRFFYPTDKNTSGWYIETSSQEMCQNGVVNKQGQVTVYNAFGNPVEQIYGFFSGGYWTGDKELSAQVLSGYAENADTYKVAFELPSDTGFDIRYLSQMVSQKQKDTTFGAFSFCHPFRILVQTGDYGLFQDESLTTEIIDDAARYAKVLCPTEQKIQLFGSSKERPSGDDVFFYADIDLKTAQIDVKRNDAAAFAKRQNTEDEKIDVENKVLINGTKTIDLNPTDDASEKLLPNVVPVVNSIDDTQVDNEVDFIQLMDKIPHLLTISRLTGKPVQGTTIVEIKRVSGKMAEVVSPVSLHLTGENLVAGWAIISGDFSYESGRKGAELTGKVLVSSVIPCSETYCVDMK